MTAAHAFASNVQQGISISHLTPELDYLSNGGLSQDEIVAQVRQHFDNKQFDVGDIRALLSSLNALPEEKDENDLRGNQFSRLEELLKAGPAEVIKMSFGAWNAAKSQLEADHQVLYLIDFENKKEGNGIGGDKVLEHLATLDSSPFSVVFTHVCSPDQEQSKATDFYTELQQQKANSYRRFSVMSKKRLSSNDELNALDSAIAPPLKRLAIGHTYRRIADVCLAGFHKGTAHALDQLDAMPVSEMYRAIFERTWTEGASEVDVICRVMNVAQRKGMFDEIVQSTRTKSTNFFPTLKALRCVADLPISEEHSPETAPYIFELHDAEIFDSEIINSMHLPLSCGDIFQKSNNGPKFILLAPPCDLMVRTDTGERNATEGVFVLLKTRSAGEAKEENAQAQRQADKNAPPKKLNIGKNQNGEVLFADFYEPFSVSLNTLDYCVWNADGAVKFNKTTPPRESGMLLEALAKRLKIAKAKCENTFPLEYRAVCFVGGPSDLQPREQPPNGEMVFPLKRIGRLRSPYAEAVLNEYLASLGRPAFEHSLF
ncbi:MAG TPA: hypothetical protein VI279_13885 [Rhodocyclaceae bacterium]